MGCTGGGGGEARRGGGQEGGKLAGVGKWARTLNASFSPSEMEIGADRGTNTFRAGRPSTRDGGCVSERFLGGHPFYPRKTEGACGAPVLPNGGGATPVSSDKEGSGREGRVMASKVKEVICRQFGRSCAAHAQPKADTRIVKAPT